MARGAFKNTVILDGSRFPPTMSRYDIAKSIKARFDCVYTVLSIQFVPGYRIQVTLKESEAKGAIEKFEEISVGAVKCKVISAGPRAQNVLLYHYPFEADNQELWRVFGPYGEIKSIRCQNYPGLDSVSSGTRVINMVRKSHIPRSLKLDGLLCKVWFAGQPVECDICG